MAQENESRKIAAQAEQNRMALLRLPVEQENNRLLAEKNRLNAENNRVIAEQSRLQAERIRVELAQAENKAKEIVALEAQNKLQKERNQLERERQAREDIAQPIPSAPPMPAVYQQHIPTAVPVNSDVQGAYPQGVYPQANVVYVDQYGRPVQK